MFSERCRICLGDGDVHRRCGCGEASWFHDACLAKWIQQSGARCEICGEAYRGLQRESRVWQVSPNQLVAVCVDCGGAVFLIYGLWWIGLFHTLKTVLVVWWIICAVTGRAAERGRRLGPAWRVHAVTYRLLPVGASRN